MRALILAASPIREIKRHSEGFQELPLPLSDIGGESWLVGLVRRLEALPGIEKIYVITKDDLQERLARQLQNTETKTPVEIITDGTSGEDSRGAVGDILFVLRQKNLKDDLLIVGGDNWFTYDLESFVRESDGKSPAVVVTMIEPGTKPSRFGWVRMDGERIDEFLEHPPEQVDADYLKASCVYMLSASELPRFEEFADARRTELGTSEDDAVRCSPGTFFSWLVQRGVLVTGITMENTWSDQRGEHLRRGSDYLEIRDIIRTVANPRNSPPWVRRADAAFEYVTSHEEVLELLQGSDINVRIIAARVLGIAAARDLLSDTATATVESALKSCLEDRNENELGADEWEEDDNEEIWVSATAAQALVKMGYAASVKDVYEKARGEGYDINEKYNT